MTVCDEKCCRDVWKRGRFGQTNESRLTGMWPLEIDEDVNADEKASGRPGKSNVEEVT